ncbi:MAG: ion transporter [Bacteroidales bacterium]|nr:ion transporter [Bacteroidales bacterium]MBN2699002.1 ion transporter [Bacteroidales bacterium]
MNRIRRSLYTVIFGTSTKAGRLFDVILIWMILLSVTVVILESVRSVRETSPAFFTIIEWMFTIVFTMEYLLRIFSHPKPFRYIFSFFGMVDLLAVLPTYAGLFFHHSTFLLTFRALRLLRMFRVFKLGRYLKEATILVKALQASIYKITVFFGAILTFVLVLGTLLYLIEGEKNGFTSIPQGMYWAIVTVTTVGYGDIAPMTVLGKILASLAMLTGYSVIAVPTGIISVEIGRAVKETRKKNITICPQCGHEKHDEDALFCKKCGAKL